MADLNFEPMVPEEIQDYSSLEEIVNILEGKLVTMVGIRQYPSSTDGSVKNHTILVGGSYTNAKLKDLVKVLSLSPSCQMGGEYWLHGGNNKDVAFIHTIADIAHTLLSPDFTAFRIGNATNIDEVAFFSAWVDVVRSLFSPDANRSNAQTDAYEKICTGIYRHTTDQNRYYIKGMSINTKVISPAINPKRTSVNPNVIAKDKIKYGLNLSTMKQRTFHLRSDDTRIHLDGTVVSIAMSTEKVREIIAVNTAKKNARSERLANKVAKEKAEAEKK